MNGPTPAPLTAASERVYCVEGVSPEITACLAAALMLAILSAIPSEFLAITV